MKTKTKSDPAARALGSADNPLLVDEEGNIVPTLMHLLYPCPRRPRHTSPPDSPRRIVIPRGTRLSRDGYRVPRDVPLTDVHIYLDAVRPPFQRTNRPHYECGICHNLKSHPVNYPCGHGHCYACARKWLETSFDCPICCARITHAPVRNLDTEAAIAYDHPEWVDRSLINYSWGGLIFPTISM
ncbi:hypothetical protein B0H11DRAFT_2250196 [Mycena galericulata]|nr:hypothetical protein B0H11DRAFT_2250196 [Mycena galericulata]